METETVEALSDLGLLVLPVGMLVLAGLAFWRADVRRFGLDVQKSADIPPMGLAPGTVRALLAFGILAGGFAMLFYGHLIKPDGEHVTFVTTIVTAVVAFYFGSRSGEGKG